MCVYTQSVVLRAVGRGNGVTQIRGKRSKGKEAKILSKDSLRNNVSAYTGGKGWEMELSERNDQYRQLIATLALFSLSRLFARSPFRSLARSPFRSRGKAPASQRASRSSARSEATHAEETANAFCDIIVEEYAAPLTTSSSSL